jgi:hypothetical protein
LDKLAREQFLSEAAQGATVSAEDLYEENHEMVESQERHQRAMREKCRSLPDVVFWEDIRALNEEPQSEPLDHVERANEDQSEPEDEEGRVMIQASLSPTHRPAPLEPEMEVDLESEHDEFADDVEENQRRQAAVEQEALQQDATAQAAEPSQLPRVELRSRDQARFNLRRWAQSILARLDHYRKEVDHLAETAQAAAEQQRNAPEDEYEEVNVPADPHTARILRHPRQFIDLSAHLGLIKDLLRHPTQPPTAPDSIIWDPADSRTKKSEQSVERTQREVQGHEEKYGRATSN